MFQKLIIQTNIWVAVCFTALFIFFQLNLYEAVYSVWGIAFFGTLAIYNFTRISTIEDFLNPKNRGRVFLTILGSVGTIICVLLRGFELKTFLYLAVLGFVSFCYSLPFKGLGLRAIPFLKLFLIAFVWAGSSIGLLLVVHHSLLQHYALFASLFFFVVGITIPFDIRDYPTDSKELKTIPQLIGINNSKYLAISSLILSGVLFAIEVEITSAFFISWFLTLVLSITLVLFSSTKRKDFYYSFWMEGCSLLPLLFYCLS